MMFAAQILLDIMMMVSGATHDSETRNKEQGGHRGSWKPM